MVEAKHSAFNRDGHGVQTEDAGELRQVETPIRLQHKLAHSASMPKMQPVHVRTCTSALKGIIMSNHNAGAQGTLRASRKGGV